MPGHSRRRERVAAVSRHTADSFRLHHGLTLSEVRETAHEHFGEAHSIRRGVSPQRGPNGGGVLWRLVDPSEGAVN